MRWLLVCFLILPVAPGWAASQTALPIQATLAGCDDDRAPVITLTAAGLKFKGLRALQPYAVNVLEHGIDLSIAADAQQTRWTDSSPRGYAREPTSVTADAKGAATLPVKVLRQFSWSRLQVELSCLGTGIETDATHVLADARIAELMEAVTETGDTIAAAQALVAMAGALLRAERPSRARMWTHFQLAALASWGGSRLREIEWLQLAYAEATELGDPVRAAVALRNIGDAMLPPNDPAAASIYDRAIQAAHDLGLADVAASAANGKCILKRMQGESEAAAACYLTTIAAFAAIGDAAAEGSARNSRATALLYVGRYDEARNELDQAVQLAERSDTPLLIARTSLVRALMARWDGDFEVALSLLNGALLLYIQLGRAADIQRAEDLIAQTYDLAQEPARAEHYFLSALARARQRGDSVSIAEIESSLARLLAARQDYGEALRLLEGSNGVLAQQSTASRHAVGLLQQATVELAANRQDSARKTLRGLADLEPSLQWRNQIKLEALRLKLGVARADFDAEAMLVPAAHAALGKGDLTLFFDLGEALLQDRERRNDHSGALQLVRLAMRSGVLVAGKVRSPLLRNALLSRLKLFAATPLWQLQDGPVPPAVVRSALAHLERLRAIEQEPFGSAPLDNALVELERVLADASRSEQASSPQREQLLLNLIDREAQGRSAAAQRIDPRAESTLWPAERSGDHALLYLVMVGSRAGALTFDARGWRWLGGLDAAGLREATQRIQALLHGGHSSRDQIDLQIATLSTALRWNELFERAPARLALVFDSELAALPWGMLPSPGDVTRDLLASAELLVLQSLRPHAGAPFTRLYGVAAGAPAAPGLPALEQTASEIAVVSASWPQLTPVTYLTASREQLTAALRQHGALVHVAAHGRGDQGRSEDAGLWLADGQGQPDFVSALRLRRTQVGAELIVLGACETGAAASGRSLGMGGVAGSLVDAGAGAVVGTRWPVSDRIAHDFAGAFHRALAQTPEAPAKALSTALQELRRSPAGRHPTHWAGWFLVRRGPLPQAASAHTE